MNNVNYIVNTYLDVNNIEKNKIIDLFNEKLLRVIILMEKNNSSV